MMCSSWKISVFGILAFILAFGLATTDAVAADPSDVGVTVSANGDTVLSAAEEGRTLTFVLSLSNTAADKDGTIQITTPSTRDGWTSPRLVATGESLADNAAAGSVSFRASSTDATSGVGGGVLTATVKSGFSGTITWEYKTNIGFEAKNHKFRIKSFVHKDNGPQLTPSVRTGAGTDDDSFVYTGGNIVDSGADLIDDAATFADNGNNIVIIVGAALSGSGKFVLSTTGIPKGLDDYKNDAAADMIDDYSRENQYIVTAEKEYNLVFTYTAAGTMLKGSVIRFTIPNDGQTLGDDDAEDWPQMTVGSSAGRLVVSGATLFSFQRGGDDVEATRDTAAAFLSSRVKKGHPVKFTYTTKTPKVVAASDATYLFTAHTISPTAAVDNITLTNAADVAPGATDAAQVGGDNAGVTFVVVQGQGGGALAVTPADGADPADHGTNISPSKDDSDPADLTLTFTAAGRMLQGSQVTVAIPNGWTPAPRTSRVRGDTENGIVEAAVARGTENSALQNILDPLNETTVAVNNRQITVTLEEGELVAGDTIVITYSGVKQPATGGVNTFAATSSSYKGERLIALAADKIPTINVVAGKGSGSIVLMKDGQPFVRTTRKTEIAELRFVYTPAGHLPKDTKVQIHIPAGWTQPIEDNTNGTVEAGEVRIAPSDAATLPLPTAADGGGWHLTATTSKVIGSSDKLTITYKKVTTPDVDPRSDVFNTRVDIDGDATVDTDGTLLARNPTVGIGQAPDGAGTMTVNMPQANAGDPIGDLVFTYIAGGDMAFGAQVELAIDPDWPKAIEDDGSVPAKQGATTLTGDGNADLTISDDGYTLTAELTTAISSGASLVFTYKNITAPTVRGSHTFYAKSKHTSTGFLTGLDESPSINVSVRAAGSVVLATTDGPLPPIQPGDALGDLQFTFTADARMEIGSKVEIDIQGGQGGWTRASEDNGDAVVIPGEVALDATDPADLEVTVNADGSYTLTATLTGVLLKDETLTFTYQEVTAPTGEGPYTFASRASAVAGGTPLDIDDPPQVVVRTAPTTLTLTASKNSFFVNESITLTVALDARAPVGGLDVALTTDPSDAGTLSLTKGGNATSTVRIDDSAESMSAMVYYTNAMAGAVTVMATSGELSDSAAVTAKSTISDLQVNALDEPIPVKGDATITVSVTGKDGRATVSVTQTVTDADGVDSHLTVVPTKSLDVVPAVPDAPESDDVNYTRDIDLGGLDDGDYTITVNIAGEPLSIGITVLNNQEPPVLSDATATPVGGATAINEGQVALSVKVTPNASDIPIQSVEADVSTLDSTRDDAPVALSDADGDDTYSAIFAIDKDNMHGDGEVMVSFTATDEYDNVSDPVTASITLRNDYTAPVLTSDMADLGMAKDGDVLTITVSSESGLTVTADASSIGGGASVTLMEGTVVDDATANGNGATANGNGATTNGNGNGAAANGDGMDANGMTEEAAMPAGNGVYTETVTVTGATDGAKMITITGTDAGGNESEAVTVTVTIDNTAPILSMASADPMTANNGMDVTISVSSESGLSITADATAIGGGMVTLTEAMAAANGMDANGMDANGMDANGMDANGMDANGMDATVVYSATVTVTGAEAGDHSIAISTMDAAGNPGEASVTVTVQIEPIVTDLMLAVDLSVVKGGSTITVSATGQAGGGTVTVMDSEGKAAVTAKALDPVGDPDADGNQAYTRAITLPAVLADGTYNLSVVIQGEMDSSTVEVLNDQEPPTLSNASAWPDVVANGGQVALRVTVTPNASKVEIASVTADVSALDDTQTEVTLSALAGEPPGTYAAFVTISADNMAADGAKTVSFTATDRLENPSDAATASITLKNDVTPPALTMPDAMPLSAADGTVITISVNGGESGLTVTADASSIGGGTAVPLSEGMAADANGNGMTNGMDANGNGMTNGMDANGNGMTNGMDANGNGMTNGMDANGNGMTNGMDANGNGMTNGMDANGNGMTNGMDANGNGMTNGMDANGNGMTNGMDANGMDDMPVGNGVYSAMVTVTGAADGAQMITITATDGSGNSSTATASVMVDNTAATLTMASADPAMAANGMVVTISVNGGESGLTVTADASAIGGDAAVSLAESADTAGSYSGMVTVTDAMDGDQMVSIAATDALDNASEAVSATVSVDNTAPALSDPAVTPDWALNGDTVTISVNGGESGLTVSADASAIGGDAAESLTEGMDADMAGTGMYSVDVTVADAMGGDQMVSISASDALGNASEAVSASVSIHVVTTAEVTPTDVSTGDVVWVKASGTAGLIGTFDVFDAEGTNIVTDGSLTEDTETAGSYVGSFEVVVDVHPTGTYWVSVTLGQASMTAEAALTIDHLAQFDLMIGAGIHLIHVPLDVTHIDGVAGTIDTVGDLYDALGGAVKFIITLGADGTWNSYLDDTSAGSAADAAIGDDTGLVAVMNSAASLRLAGNALGTGGAATITLSAGNNLVGVPLDGDLLSMISDALSPLVSAIVVSNEAGNGFNAIAQAGDPGDGAIMGGVGYLVQASAAASIPVIGAAWDNSGMMEDAGATVAMNGGAAANGNGASTAPSIGFQTPVLHVQGKLIDQAGMMSREGLNVTVKNLTSGAVLGRTTATDDYSMTFVKLDSSAAKVGEVIEIKADSPNPLLGIRPVQHVVTAEDVLDSRISLPDLVTYEIPALTELLANYPNPFNPETWIPFRLAEDARVSLTIYGASGSLVRSIDIGFTPAAIYQGRSDAIYWDGRNDFGEQVSSGIYFYHLNAGDFSATRKMVIVK